MGGRSVRGGSLMLLVSLALALGACQSPPPPASPTSPGVQPPVDTAPGALDADLQALQATVGEERAAREEVERQLEDALQTLEVRTAMLEGLLREAGDLDTLEEQNQQLERRIETVRDTALALLDDRELLIELRKDTPAEKMVALAYWRKIKTLAVRSDPSLARPADRVINGATAYYAWDDREYASDDERVQQYFISGAEQYPREAEEFNKDVLFVLINRIDAISLQAGGG